MLIACRGEFQAGIQVSPELQLEPEGFQTCIAVTHTTAQWSERVLEQVLLRLLRLLGSVLLSTSLIPTTRNIRCAQV